MIKLLYKPLGLAVSVLGGVLAGAIFKRLWKVTARQDQPPRPPTPTAAGARS
jgi:Protein of unknown function (DUF4235)